MKLAAHRDLQVTKWSHAPMFVLGFQSDITLSNVYAGLIKACSALTK